MRRRDVRLPLIDEAVDALTTATFVVIEGHMGFGRTLKITEAVREALVAAGQEEKEELTEAVSEAREKLIERRLALV